jgi:hypothetical protein
MLEKIARCIAIAGAWLLLVAAGTAAAFERSDGQMVSCEVEYAGRSVKVPEEYVGNGPVGTTHPALGGSAAVVRRNPDGSSRMIFDRFVMERIAQRSKLAADLVFYHECAHIRLQSDDEIQANCEAVRQMREVGYLDDDGYAALTAWHESMGRVAPRYGGTGRVFWQRTEACLARHAPPAPGGTTVAGPAAKSPADDPVR